MDLKEDFKRIQGAGLSGLCFAFVVAATPVLSGCSSSQFVRGVFDYSLHAGTVGPREAARRELRGALGLRATACPGGVFRVPGQGPATDIVNRLFSLNYIPQLGDGTCRGDNGQGTPLDSYSTPVPLPR